jgi:hypothetical protein
MRDPIIAQGRVPLENGSTTDLMLKILEYFLTIDSIQTQYNTQLEWTR